MIFYELIELLFCNITYSSIKFIQRIISPFVRYTLTKPFWLSLLYKKSGRFHFLIIF